jgi:hypothetical protein
MKNFISVEQMVKEILSDEQLHEDKELMISTMLKNEIEWLKNNSLIEVLGEETK